MRAAILLALMLGSASCAAIQQSSRLIARPTTAYKQVLTESDRIRLRDWRANFASAINEARAAGHGVEIDREGTLLDPDAALADPAIPNGTYRCRQIKLGRQPDAMRDFATLPPETCRVLPEGQLQRFVQAAGEQRIVGLVFSGDALRRVLLGTLMLGDEQRAMQYGQDEKRDVAAYLERIGPNRWRLILPAPHFDSRLDVIEMVPAEG